MQCSRLTHRDVPFYSCPKDIYVYFLLHHTVMFRQTHTQVSDRLAWTDCIHISHTHTSPAAKNSSWKCRDMCSCVDLLFYILLLKKVLLFVTLLHFRLSRGPSKVPLNTLILYSQVFTSLSPSGTEWWLVGSSESRHFQKIFQHMAFFFFPVWHWCKCLFPCSIVPAKELLSLMPSLQNSHLMTMSLIRISFG